ncbi:hypothetical protein NQ314_000574 [Rhamnusium bicolor]|uniref:Uncharacterized protein n=1 Tax=Rhamnusium bicolor TaxID=1586634 RepID=A0AAV8ZV15_9CUCU|nr:hypothetical protein NQ314_000574 [Rhamnusium bicolor]
MKYLAAGNTFQDMDFAYYRGKSTIAKIVRYVCRAIWDHLKNVELPKLTEVLMEQIAQDFDKKANFSNCMGALNGKHIRIVCSDHGGSLILIINSFMST